MTPAVSFRGVSRHFGAVRAADDLTFDIADGEFFVLLGETGAGKTTTLRLIAGLEKPTSGQVFIDGVDVADWGAAERDVALVLQQYSLYPRYTVRENLEGAAATGVAATVGPFVHVRPARAAKTLRILQWSHFVPAYDKWFNGQYVKEWGAKNDTEVTVDNINLNLIPSRAAAEVSAQKGHDLVMFLSPPSVYEEQVVPMNDVYAEVEKKHGKPIDLAIKSTYNPKTKKYFAFSDSFVPDPINYRSDLWGEAGMKPDSWDDIRVGGKKIKDKTGIPVGVGLSAELDSAMALRSLLYSFGGAEQDAEQHDLPEVPAEADVIAGRQDRRQVGADPEIGGLAERGEAGEAEQDVETHRQDGKDQRAADQQNNE